MAKLNEQLEKLTPLQRAVFALKETQARLDALERRQKEPIAIVGIACRFPGGAVGTEAYWRLLREGREAIRETPPERWDVDAFYDPDPQAPGKINCRGGGYLENVDLFDNAFFGISEREAEFIDPQQRMLLELVWEALEDAGIPPSSVRGSKTGVFVGISVSDYAMLLSGKSDVASAYVGTGTSLSIAANRISFAFDLHGPSIAVDTACSSSLVALHLACQSLRQGESSLAVVGGSNLVLSPFMVMNLTKAGMTTSSGHVRAFDAAASGFLRSDGAATVVLKPLSAALAHRDPIYAVIRGSAVNTSGQSNGLSAPSRAAQEAVLREAYEAAQVSPALVQYIETQGTATPIGDAIEAQALGSFLAPHRSLDARVAIGSVKTNLGHTEAAAGMASLIKVALAMQHGELPATLHFEQPNPNIAFDRLPLKVQQQCTPWPAHEGRRIAGVSAFGFGGSNAHVVLENASALLVGPEPSNEGGRLNAPGLLLLSAKTDTALRALAEKYVAYLGESREAWADVCYTAAARREHLDCRLAVSAASAKDAASALELFLRVNAPASLGTATADQQPLSGSGKHVCWGRKPFGHRVRVAYWFGNATAVQTGWEASIQHLAGVQQWLETAERVLAADGLAARSVLEVQPQDAVAVRLSTLIQQIALAIACRELGTEPHAVAGSGVGELAAAVTAGCLEAGDALHALIHAARRGADHGLLNGNRPALRPPQIALESFADPALAQRREFDLEACLLRTEQSCSPAAANQWLASRPWNHVLEMSQAVLDMSEAEEKTAGAGPATRSPAQRLHVLCSDNAGAPMLDRMLQQLYVAGAEIRWNRCFAGARRCVHLPAYPWQGKRHWLEAARPVQHHHATGAATPVDATRPRPELTVPYVEPQTPLERDMVRAWSELLKIENVGIHDDFFELGGDSLQATILKNQLQQRLGESIPTMVLFEAHTIYDLARYLEATFPAAVERAYTRRDTAASDGQSASAPAARAAAYQPNVPTIQAQPRSYAADQLLAQIDDLSDEEVERLLQENLHSDNPGGGASP